MKALDPPSERFSRSLQNTRFELNINAKEVKTNHFVQVPIPLPTPVDASTVDNNSTLSPNGGESYLESPPKPSAEASASPPKGLYAYGDATISADKLVPMKKIMTKLGVSSPKASPGKKSPTKKDNPLRPPVIDRRALSIPVQQPPPPQPLGPVPAALIATQNSILFSAKSTTSLLGLHTSTSGSFHSFQDLLTPVSALPESKTEVKAELKPDAREVLKPEIFNQYSHRPKLNSIDLLSDIGDEIDVEAKEARERAASIESFNERHSIGSFTPHGMSFGVHNFDPPRATTPGTGLGVKSSTDASFLMSGRSASPRPTSPSVQLFDFNAMAKNNDPPAPSTLEKQQQGLSLQMKMAYLNATTTNDENSRKSRPGSRAHSSSHAARNIITPVATQVFRVPSALSQEPSFFSSSGDYNPTESMDSLSKIPMLEEGSMAIDTKSNLHMDSEIDVTLASSIHKTKTVSLVGAQKSTLKQASLRASHSTTIPTAAQVNPTPAQVKVAGFAGADALTHTEIPSTMAPSLQALLPAQQLETLQQPHYQDPRFQKNPREVIYKFHGHLLNTTPFPEEIAHLTLHGKSSRLPQYLKVQQEQQQLRYNNKVRVLASMQPQKHSERAELAPVQKYPPVGISQALTQSVVPKVMDFSDFEVIDTSREPEHDTTAPGDAMQTEPPQQADPPAVEDSQVSTKTKMTIRDELGSASDDFMVADAAFVGDTASVASAASAGEVSVAASIGGGSFTNGSVGGGGSVTGGSVARSITSLARSVSGDADSMQEGVRSRPASRSLSIRLTPAGGMIEEHNIAINTKSSSALNMLSLISDSAPPSAPAPAPVPVSANASGSLMMLVNEGSSNKIAAGFVRAASNNDANRPASPPSFEDTLPNTFREEFVVKGAPTGPGLKIKTKFSPGRVAYVLNKHSPAAMGSGDEYDAHDDNQSLHSVHSLQNSVPTVATGNYSAITEDGNFSILKSQMSPLPRRPNGFVSADNSHTGVNSKYRPRLDSVAGGSSLASETEPPVAMPYQVHRKVMGWKLTSTLQRRRNLVGMLDLVHNAHERKTHENKHPLEPKLAPPLQIPHALLRTGHGKRTRNREVPPLGLVHAHMMNVHEAQQQLQETQVMHGFEYSTKLLSDKNFGSNPNLSRSFSATLKTPKTHKNKNALRASTSNLGNLAIQVENMGRYLPSDTPFDSP